MEAIAASLDEISGVRLRQVRAIEVLEMLGTTEARGAEDDCDGNTASAADNAS